MAGLIAGDADARTLLHPLRPTRIAEEQLLTSSDTTMIFQDALARLAITTVPGHV